MWGAGGGYINGKIVIGSAHKSVMSHWFYFFFIEFTAVEARVELE